MRISVHSRTALAAAVAITAACSDATAPTAVSRTTAQASLDGGTAPSVVMLCKIGPAGSTATFSVSANGGELRAGSSVTVQATSLEEMATCVEIWRATDLTAITDITVTETGASAGTKLEEVVWQSGIDGWGVGDVAGQTATVRASWESEAMIWFKNIEVDLPPPPPPPVGLAGCTPGFWRQAHHYQYWTSPYAPTMLFSDVFADAFPGMTLGQVVKLGGGGLSALGRHTVAALLNGASTEVDYGMTALEVVAAFNAAYASGSFEAQKNIFEGYNERGCSVDKSGSTSDGESEDDASSGPPAGKGKPAHAGKK